MIVITGATGNVGSALVEALTRSERPVTAVSRRRPQNGLPRGVEHRRADLAEPDTLKPILAGAESLFLLVAGDAPEPVIEIARSCGVRRIVLLSSMATGTRPSGFHHPRAFETAVRQSDLEWTILRPGGFASNALGWAETVRATGTVHSPFGDVALPVIDPADIAEVAAAVLTRDGHRDKTYELTGPEVISPRDQARVIGEVVGQPVEFIEMTRDRARKAMTRFMPEPVVEDTLSVLGEPLEAEQRVSPHVAEIVGREPRPFAAWVERHRAVFG